MSANSQKRTLRTRVPDLPPMAQGSVSFWHRSGQLYARRVGDGAQGLRCRAWIAKERFQTLHSGVFEVCRSNPRGKDGLSNCFF